jgi:hypothetical protein
LGRLGLLAMGFAEILPADKPEQSKERETALVQIASWMADMIAANVCLCRPILDIQHIEIYLAFLTLYQTRRVDQLEQFFVDLIERLYLRRFGRGDLPFLDAHNSLENVFEQVATRPAEPLVSTTSSYFVLMLMELSCALPNREHLLALIHRRLVLGAFDEGDPGKNTPLDLISWIAPADWDPKVFEGNITGGEVVSTRPFSESRDATGKHLYDSIMNFVRQTNAVSKLKFVRNTPTTALVLASLRHQSALPPELWRKIIFPELEPAKA